MARAKSCGVEVLELEQLMVSEVEAAQIPVMQTLFFFFLKSPTLFNFARLAADL